MLVAGEEEEGADFLGQPKDWIDSFSRHFYPSEHRHLGEHKGGHHEGENEESGRERELLPWLKLAATLDPERPETYIVASFWLRTQRPGTAGARNGTCPWCSRRGSRRPR